MHSTRENTKINHYRMCQHMAQSVTRVFPIFFDKRGLILGATMLYQDTYIYSLRGIMQCWTMIGGGGRGEMRVVGHPKGNFMKFDQYVFTGCPFYYDFLAGGREGA